MREHSPDRFVNRLKLPGVLPLIHDAVDRKLHDIAASGPVVLTPDFAKLGVAGLTPDAAGSYAPVNITVSYAGQDGMPKPFLLIINWTKVSDD